MCVCMCVCVCVCVCVLCRYLFSVEKQKENENDDDKSYLEVLKDMRDYRRRRQSYRAKNVHITKKTPKQV